jgi:hypothetical protein
MPVPWHEPACLVRAYTPPGRAFVREIVLEGSFAEVAVAFSRFRADQWAELTISFTERRAPPFRYEAMDFDRHVITRLLGIEGV